MRWSEAREKLPNVPWNPYQGADSKENAGPISRVYNLFLQQFPVGGNPPRVGELFPVEGRDELLRKVLKTVFPAVASCGRPGFENRIAEFLDDDELWEEIGAPPKRTRYTFYFARSLDDMDCYVRALALCYTLSTFLPWQIAEMGEVYRALSEHRIDDLMDTWFLIVTYPLVPYHHAKFCEGDAISFFEKRRRMGKTTTFVDIAQGSEASLRLTVERGVGGLLGRLLSDPYVYYIC